MKVVINKCYGGFDLSPAAEDAYAAAKGITLYRYMQTHYKYQHGFDKYVKVGRGMNRLYYTLIVDCGEEVSELPKDESVWMSFFDMDRADPDLIRIVEEMGEAADGSCAELHVIEIPDDVEFVIQEYDGIEHIAEKHRTWG